MGHDDRQWQAGFGNYVKILPFFLWLSFLLLDYVANLVWTLFRNIFWNRFMGKESEIYGDLTQQGGLIEVENEERLES